MTNAAFDTLKFLQKLKASGMPELQAIALTQAQNEAFMETTDHMMATKADLLELGHAVKQDITDLRQEFTDLSIEVKQDITDLRAEVKQDITDLRAEVKQDISDLRVEVKQDISDLRVEVKQDISDLRREFHIELACVKSHLKHHNWMIGFVLTGIGALILKTFFA